jgi:hypothetical protein
LLSVNNFSWSDIVTLEITPPHLYKLKQYVHPKANLIFHDDLPGMLEMRIIYIFHSYKLNIGLNFS